MSEFPALRDALVGAATRRRRRRRVTAGAAPALLAAAAAAAFATWPGGTPDPERVAETPTPTPAAATPLEQAFSIFRRPQTAADKLPSGRVVSGTVDAAKSRLLARSGKLKLYAVPTVSHGRAMLCVVETRPAGGSAGCGPLKPGTIGEDFAPGTSSGDVFAMLLPDGSHDVELTLRNGDKARPQVRDNGIVLATKTAVGSAAWTGASGTRYTMRNEFAPEATTPPRSCPAKLDPLPANALDEARRTALIAAGDLYPYADEATAVSAVRAKGTPCDLSFASRTVLVTLKLRPRSVKHRKDPKLTHGLVLVGMVRGKMTVYYVAD